MLPDVDADERDEAGRRLEGVLVSAGRDLGLLGGPVVREPAPAGTLHGDGLGAELLLHVFEGAEAGVDEGSELAGGGSVLGGRAEVLPEESVVDVAAAVELDLQGSRGLGVGAGVMARAGSETMRFRV